MTALGDRAPVMKPWMATMVAMKKTPKATSQWPVTAPIAKIVCAEGTFLNEDNECEKRRAKATVRRDDNDRSSRRARRERPDSPDRAAPGFDAGYRALPPQQQARPLTGDERQWGCNSNQAIMSGRCP